MGMFDSFASPLEFWPRNESLHHLDAHVHVRAVTVQLQSLY